MMKMMTKSLVIFIVHFCQMYYLDCIILYLSCIFSLSICSGWGRTYIHLFRLVDDVDTNTATYLHHPPVFVVWYDVVHAIVYSFISL